MQQIEFPSSSQDKGLASFVQKKNLPIDSHWRCRKNAPDPFFPDDFSCLGIRARHNAVLGCHVDEPLIIEERGDVGSTRGDAPHNVRLGYVSTPPGSNRHIGAATVP